MESLLPLGTAFWLGLLTAISPCPLATNIAAISYIGKRVDRPLTVFLSGALYTFGRMLAYTILGALLVASVLSAPEVSRFLQKYMNQFLGPLLVLVGMFLLELIKWPTRGSSIGERLQPRINRAGIWGALLMGIIFALAFCPVSAALFFGSLVPLAVKHSSIATLPSVYGIATGLPVICFALLIALGARSVSKVFARVTQFELWARRVTGVMFILVGVYLSFTYIFGII